MHEPVAEGFLPRVNEARKPSEHRMPLNRIQISWRYERRVSAGVRIAGERNDCDRIRVSRGRGPSLDPVEAPRNQE